MNKKSSGVACVAVVAVLAWSYHVYAGKDSSQDIWGPYFCTRCTLSTPMPDVATTAFIQRMEIANYPGVGLLIYRATGDKYVICNGQFCASYTRTDDKNLFLGGEVTRQETAVQRSRSSARSGGGSGDGGTAAGPGTTVVRNPSVTVGDPKAAGK